MQKSSCRRTSSIHLVNVNITTIKVSNTLYFIQALFLFHKNIKSTINIQVMKMSEETTTLTNTELVIYS